MQDLGLLILSLGGVCLVVGCVLYVRWIGLTSSSYPPASGHDSVAIAPAGDIRGEFQRARLGQSITLMHPVRGQITGMIAGSITYAELWQRVKSPSEPWVHTGNRYTAHWLDDFMLYEWKDNLFVLDEYEPLSDQQIVTDFLPYAKQFGESDETADVSFTFPPATWKITDIGKFSVLTVQGTGLRLDTGAVGRFIHANAYGDRALVVEDFQSGGGGQDTAWNGYQIKWEDIQRIG